MEVANEHVMARIAANSDYEGARSNSIPNTSNIIDQGEHIAIIVLQDLIESYLSTARTIIIDYYKLFTAYLSPRYFIG